MAHTKCLGFLVGLIGFILFFIYPGFTTVIVLYMMPLLGTFMNWDVFLPDLFLWILGLILLILGSLFYVEISLRDDKLKAFAIVSFIMGMFLFILYPGFNALFDLSIYIQYGNIDIIIILLYMIFWVLGIILFIFSVIYFIRTYGTKGRLKKMKDSDEALEEKLDKIEVSLDISGTIAPNTCPKCGGWFPPRMYRCEICGYEREE